MISVSKITSQPHCWRIMHIKKQLWCGSVRRPLFHDRSSQTDFFTAFIKVFLILSLPQIQTFKSQINMFFPFRSIQQQRMHFSQLSFSFLVPMATGFQLNYTTATGLILVSMKSKTLQQ